MKTELEVKILDINIDIIKSKLKNLNAIYKWEKMMKRYVYDFTPKQQGKWVRLRDNWTETTITIKETTNDNVDWTKELEIVVDLFDNAHEMLKKLWYQETAYQENKRTSYDLKWVNIEIDERPLIPPYLEIEWDSIEAVYDIVNLLWYVKDDTTSINTTKVYSKYWIELDSITLLSFNH